MAKAALRNPDFIGIGVQKAGTTWLYSNLKAHPRLWMPPVKELHFFDAAGEEDGKTSAVQIRRAKANERLAVVKARRGADRAGGRHYAALERIAGLDETEDSYRAVFGLCPEDWKCGEITPSYSVLPEEGVRRVHAVAPEAKIVLSLRDPIERAWSQLRMAAKDETDVDSLSTRNAVRRSQYPAIIDLWSSVFGAENVLIVFLDRIETNPLAVLRRVSAHIGAPFKPSFFPDARQKVLGGEARSIPESVYSQLKDELRPVYVEMEKRFPDVGAAWMTKHYAD